MDDYDPYCRYPASTDAVVDATGLRAPLGCVIRNISEGGALLALERPAQLPKRIFLSLRKGADALECEVRWRSSNRLYGVRFEPSNKAETLSALLKACAASQRRGGHRGGQPPHAPREQTDSPLRRLR